MSVLGLGVMIQKMLAGPVEGDREAAKACFGKTIRSASLAKAGDTSGYGSDRDHDTVVLEFDDGWKLLLWDAGQSCCEARYITCDDDLNSIAGQRLREIEGRPVEGPARGEDDYGEHEQMFVAIQTDKSEVVLCTHNEHNGYYGGFAVTVKAIAP